MADIINKTHDLISYANSNRNRISKIIINGVLLFIIFAIFGCFDFVNFTIDITLIANWKYWTSVFSKTVGGSIAFNIGINLLFDKEVEADKQLEEQREKYEDLIPKRTKARLITTLTIFSIENKRNSLTSPISIEKSFG